jgi:DNA polymerase elongation subunit (family B)
MALKILLNSLYGALGNKYFRHFDVNMAESITTAGQLSIRWIERTINKYMNKIMLTGDVDYIIASDTDSVYVTFDSLVSKLFDSTRTIKDKVDFLDNIGTNQFRKIIDESYQELADYTNAYDQKMFMDREAIADSTVFFAKKRYIMNVLDNEGFRYETPKIKMMGIEAIKSTTPPICRTALKEFIKIIINGTEKEAQEYYSNFKLEFKKDDYIDIAFPRTANNIDKFYDSTSIYKKGTPIHVRGSILYNEYIRILGLDSKYEYIENGTKIKFCYLKMPNPIKSNVISVPSVLPREFELSEYIDYDLQFEKTFLMPVDNMLKIINWTPEKRNTLEDFFT